MLDQKIILCLYGVVREDDQDVMKLTQETEVFAKEEGLTNAFYFKTNSEGYQVSTSFLIHPFEYQGEQQVKAGGKAYKVERTRPVVKYDLDLLELIVGEMHGQG